MSAHYEVEGSTFPADLRGLTQAIRLGREFATSGPVEVRKVTDGGTSVAYTVPHTPYVHKPRKGYYDPEVEGAQD